jgi:serralysin
MARWTFSPPQAGQGADMATFLFTLFSMSQNRLTSTSMRYFEPGGASYVFSGQNLAFSDPGTGLELVSGKITGLTLRVQDKLVMQVEGWNLSAPVIHDGIAANDIQTAVYLLSGADRMTGTKFDDTLGGVDGADRIFGGAGIDELEGGNDADTLYGGAGSDNLNGGNDRDTVYGGGGADFFADDGGDDLLYGGGGGDSINGGVDNDRMFGDGAGDSLSGFDGNDRLFGGAGNDAMVGGDGQDVLNGGLGQDSMLGGAHADIFVFDTTLGATNVDAILGYDPAFDSIRLDNDIFTALGAAGALAPGRYHEGTAAAQAGDLIIYDPATGRLWYDANGSAQGQKVLFAQVAAATMLSAAEFQIIG